MNKTLPTLLLITALSGLTTATRADLVVWSQDFESEPLGPYGTTENYGTQPTLSIVNPTSNAGAGTNAMEITYVPTTGANVNYQCLTLRYPATGNTNLILANYTLEMDMKIDPFTPGFVFEISVQGDNGGTFATNVSRVTVGSPPLPAAGAGWMHLSFPLSNSVPGNAGVPVAPTSATFRIGFGGLAFPSPVGDGATPEVIDVDNIVLLMNTNPPPVPPPTIHVVTANPGLRVFEQNSAQTFNQEGFGTVDSNQSWLGSTPENPTTYRVTLAGFPPTVNTTLHMQFVTTAAINPFVVFGSPNAMEWRIRRTGSGFFDQRIAWKTNAPNNGGLPNISLPNTVSSSTTGIGTWTLQFTSDTNGTVTAPDGTSTPFTLPPEMVAFFFNPVTIDFGTTPGSTAGFGEYFDFSRITITNSVGVDDDNFTKDDVLNTALWDPAFSLDPGSVIQVSTNTPFWVNWTVPDDLFGLGTKASLNRGTNQWFSPNYYGSGVGITNSLPRKMGTTLKWTLIPSACLPTLDGTVGGPASTSGFFLMQNPVPSM